MSQKLHFQFGSGVIEVEGGGESWKPEILEYTWSGKIGMKLDGKNKHKF